MGCQVKSIILKIILAISAIRLIPHLLLLYTAKNRELIKADLSRWSTVYLRRPDAHPKAWLLIHFMTNYPEFRNIFYHRTGLVGKVWRPLCRPMSTLFLATPKIGAGLFIQHGFASIVAAKEIGENCWINQQVTIGYSHKGERPTISNNVTVNAGAKIIGGITVHDDSVIGANAVVITDIPAGATAVGVPAQIVKIYGQRIS